MSNDQLAASDVRSPKVGSSRFAALSVAQDFDVLIGIFEEQLQSVPASDHETRLQLCNAKAAAERGAELSRELLKRA
jgi:hypothetical protein